VKEIKADVDPESFFRFRRSVDSDFEPRLSRPLDLSPSQPDPLLIHEPISAREYSHDQRHPRVSTDLH
jgi:hypothetical protein